MPCARFLRSARGLALGKQHLCRVPVVWHSTKAETLGKLGFSGSAASPASIPASLTRRELGMRRGSQFLLAAVHAATAALIVLHVGLPWTLVVKLTLPPPLSYWLSTPFSCDRAHSLGACPTTCRSGAVSAAGSRKREPASVVAGTTSTHPTPAPGSVLSPAPFCEIVSSALHHSSIPQAS